MRKKLLLIFAVIMIPISVYGFGLLSSGGAGAGSPDTCTTEADSNQGSDEVGNQLVGLAGSDYVATQFTAGGDRTICKASFYLRNNTGDAMNVTVTAYIWTNNPTPDPDEPQSSATCTSTTTHNPSTDFTESYDWYDFDFSGCSLTNATLYWAGVGVSGQDGTDYFQWEYDNGAGVEVIARDDDDSGSWTNVTTARQGKFILYE